MDCLALSRFHATLYSLVIGCTRGYRAVASELFFSKKGSVHAGAMEFFSDGHAGVAHRPSAIAVCFIDISQFVDVGRWPVDVGNHWLPAGFDVESKPFEMERHIQGIVVDLDLASFFYFAEEMRTGLPC